ncbi:24386_t:CDS:2, partial [Racocetra persica]
WSKLESVIGMDVKSQQMLSLHSNPISQSKSELQRSPTKQGTQEEQMLFLHSNPILQSTSELQGPPAKQVGAQGEIQRPLLQVNPLSQSLLLLQRSGSMQMLSSHVNLISQSTSELQGSPAKQSGAQREIQLPFLQVNPLSQSLSILQIEPSGTGEAEK